ncbi:hypothetical protein V1506DRAFT_169153 [Lipomyces tetrasporus]
MAIAPILTTMPNLCVSWQPFVGMTHPRFSSQESSPRRGQGPAREDVYPTGQLVVGARASRRSELPSIDSPIQPTLNAYACSRSSSRCRRTSDGHLWRLMLCGLGPVKCAMGTVRPLKRTAVAARAYACTVLTRRTSLVRAQPRTLETISRSSLAANMVPLVPFTLPRYRLSLLPSRQTKQSTILSVQSIVSLLHPPVLHCLQRLSWKPTPNHGSVLKLLSIKRQRIATSPLVDSGATADFIGLDFAKQHNMPMRLNEVSLTVHFVDGREVRSGTITHEVHPGQNPP